MFKFLSFFTALIHQLPSFVIFSTFLKIPHKKEKKHLAIFSRGHGGSESEVFHYDMTLELTWEEQRV